MKKAYLIILKQNAYSLKKNYFCMMQKKECHERNKRFRNKSFNKGDCKLFSFGFYVKLYNLW